MDPPVRRSDLQHERRLRPRRGHHRRRRSERTRQRRHGSTYEAVAPRPPYGQPRHVSRSDLRVRLPGLRGPYPGPRAENLHGHPRQYLARLSRLIPQPGPESTGDVRHAGRYARSLDGFRGRRRRNRVRRCRRGGIRSRGHVDDRGGVVGSGPVRHRLRGGRLGCRLGDGGPPGGGWRRGPLRRAAGPLAARARRRRTPGCGGPAGCLLGGGFRPGLVGGSRRFVR